MTIKQVRAGDVFLERVDKIPKTAIKQEKGGPVLVIEYGEVTFHKHVIPVETGDLYLDGQRQYLETCLVAPLTHEEHSVIELPVGKYVRHKQLTYDYAAEMAKQVLD